MRIGSFFWISTAGGVSRRYNWPSNLASRIIPVPPEAVSSPKRTRQNGLPGIMPAIPRSGSMTSACSFSAAIFSCPMAVGSSLAAMKPRMRGLRHCMIRAIIWCICRSGPGQWGFCTARSTRTILPRQPDWWCASGKKWPAHQPRQRCCLLRGEKSDFWLRSRSPTHFFRNGRCRPERFRSGRIYAFC